MSAVAAMADDLAALGKAAAAAALAGDWHAVERYEAVRMKLLRALSGLGADAALRADVVDALRNVLATGEDMAAAMAHGRQASEASSSRAAAAGRAGQAYLQARSA